MLIIYFLLGLGITTAHSDYGVSFRAQKFDKTVQNIDNESYIKHQRVKRFVTGYSVPQNLTNKPAWGNLNITRNNIPFTRPTNNISVHKQIFLNNGTRPNNHVTVHPGQPGYVVPLRNTTGFTLVRLGPYGNTTDVTGKHVHPRQNYNTNVTWPVNSNYTIVKPANKNNFSNSYPSGYNVQPVNIVTPGKTPYYPVPNTGYPAPNKGNVAPNKGYPAPNTGYPIPNSGYPAPNTGYPIPSSGYPAPNTGYRVPNTGYPASNTGYTAPSGYPVPNTFYPTRSSVIPPANVTGFFPKPNPGLTIHNAVPRNNSNGFNNTGNGFNNNSNGFNNNGNGFNNNSNGFNNNGNGFNNNSNGFNNNGNGFNNTASLANCKCNLPRANSTITKKERTMDACMITCNNNCPAGMKMAFGVCVKDFDNDDE